MFFEEIVRVEIGVVGRVVGGGDGFGVGVGFGFFAFLFGDAVEIAGGETRLDDFEGEILGAGEMLFAEEVVLKGGKVAVVAGTLGVSLDGLGIDEGVGTGDVGQKKSILCDLLRGRFIGCWGKNFNIQETIVI